VVSEKSRIFILRFWVGVPRPPPGRYRNITHMRRVSPYGPDPHYIIKIRIIIDIS